MAGTLDTAEVARFGAMADAWWDPAGKFRPLHEITPARMSFIRRELCRGRHIAPNDLKPLAGQSILDIGCGGGLTAEPLARLGATVTAIDPAAQNIEAAAAHARDMGLAVDYRAMRAEDLIKQGVAFDAVICLEVIEHVPDVPAFIGICGSLVKPGGRFIMSTINRTLASYGLAIVAAEYVLGWLPRGTHRWDRFVTPAELDRMVTDAGFRRAAFEGLVYSPLSRDWRLGNDVRVNYLASADKPASS